MDPRLRLTLSPIALATALAVGAVGTLAAAPWLPGGVAEASHCASPPSCDSSCYTCACDCACVCDYCGCGAYREINVP